MKMTAMFVAALAGVAASANGQVDLARWTFETSVPTTAGPFAAEAGVFAATSQASGSTGGTYSNPVGNGSGESFSSNGWDAGDFYQFTTSAAGYESLFFGWSQTRSSTGPSAFELRLSINGGGFQTLLTYSVTDLSWSSNPANLAPGSVFVPVALPAAANGAASLTFRLVSTATVVSTGTNRVDDVFVRGTVIPAPGAAALLGVGGLVAARRRRA